MTALLLATLLNLSPGDVRLANDVKPRAAMLADTRFKLQFVADEPPMPPPPPPPPGPEEPTTSVEGMTRAQIEAQLAKLEENKPSLGGPIVLMAIGGSLTVIGTFFLIDGALSGAVVGIVLGTLFLLPGIAMAVIGTILFINRLPLQKGYAADKERLENRLRRFGPAPVEQDERAPGPPPPPPGDDGPPGPPPPPPPPQANLVLPGPLTPVFVF